LPGVMQGQGAGWLGAWLPLIILFAIFYFLLIRPQQVQQRKRRDMLQSLKKGDKVVTVGGIHGTITEIRDDELKLRIADKVEIELSRSGVGQVLGD